MIYFSTYLLHLHAVLSYICTLDICAVDIYFWNLAVGHCDILIVHYKKASFSVMNQYRIPSGFSALLSMRHLALFRCLNKILFMLRSELQKISSVFIVDLLTQIDHVQQNHCDMLFFFFYR